MRKSYIAQSAFTLNDVSIRPGDILVHDPNNGSKLIVYRNREIVKITVHSALGMQAMLMNKWVSLHEEPSAPPVSVRAVQTAPSVKTEVPAPVTEEKVRAPGDDLMKKPKLTPNLRDGGSPPTKLSRAERKLLRSNGWESEDRRKLRS